MIKYTDYIVKVEIDQEALEGLDYVIVSIKQSNIKIDKTIEASKIDNNIISVAFSQEETGSFVIGNAELQVNAFYMNERHASNIVKINIYENLLDEVKNG